MTHDSNVDGYDTLEQSDAAKPDLYPTFEIFDGPEPLTIDGHRLIEDFNDDD